MSHFKLEPALLTPQNLNASVERSLSKCQKSVAATPPTGNQPITDGLNSCFYQAKHQLKENTERAVAKIDLVKDDNCRKLYQELNEKWIKYSEEIFKIPRLSVMPYNTDDDLEVILLGHRYEIAYAILSNSGCRE